MSPVFDKSRLIDLAVGRPWLTLVTSVAVIAAIAAGIVHLVTVDVGIRNHFNQNDPHLIELEKFEDTYAVSDSVLVVVAPPHDTIFSLESLVAIEQLTEALWQAPYVTRVDSITNHSHSEGTEDDLIVEQLVEDSALLDDAKIDRIQTIALSSPEIAGRFVSRDGRFAGLIVSLVLPDNIREKQRFEVVDALHEIIDEHVLPIRTWSTTAMANCF